MATMTGSAWDGTSSVTMGFGSQNNPRGKKLSADEFLQYQVKNIAQGNARLGILDQVQAGASAARASAGQGYNPATGGYDGGKGSNSFGGDWTSGNSNFSTDGVQKLAKDMAEMHLNNSKTMMAESFNWRDKEASRDQGFRQANADQDSTLRMRETGQQQGFAEKMEGINQSFKERMQLGEYAQQDKMFDKQQRAESETTRNRAMRAAATFHRGSPFRKFN